MKVWFWNRTFCSRSFSRIFFISALISTRIIDGQYVLDVVETTEGSYRVMHNCQAKSANIDGMESLGYASETTGCISFIDSEKACSPIAELYATSNKTPSCKYDYAFVPEDGCSISEKTYQIQKAQYQALVIYSETDDWPVSIAKNMYQQRVNIPVILVNHSCAEEILKFYSAKHKYKIRLRVTSRYYILTKFHFLLGTVFLCVVFLLISMWIQVYRERHQKSTGTRLSKRKVRNLPTRICRKCDTLTACAICLDDFAVGERLRILPCNHSYHVKCVDPWLTKNQSVCPLCKKDIFLATDHDLSAQMNERAILGMEAGVLSPRLARIEQLPLVRRTPRGTTGAYMPGYQLLHDSPALLRQKISPLMEVLKDGMVRSLAEDQKLFRNVPNSSTFSGNAQKRTTRIDDASDRASHPR